MSLANSSTLFLGSIERRTLISAKDNISIDQASGNVLYAAAANMLFGRQASIYARIGSNYPKKWLQEFEEKGIDCSRINRLHKELEHRSFTVIAENLEISHKNIADHFARLNTALPKSLLDFAYTGERKDERHKRRDSSWREEDLLNNLEGVKAAHICPHDYLSHHLIPSVLRESGIEKITLESRESYMHSDFRNDIPNLVNGLSAFFTNERQMNMLLSNSKTDIWEKAAYLGDFNCECVIIQTPGRGQYVYISEEKQRFHIPPYPTMAEDVSFSTSSFAGAFLASLMNGDDHLDAALNGAAAMSIAIQGIGPFYILDSFIGLAESRKNSLAQAVKHYY